MSAVRGGGGERGQGRSMGGSRSYTVQGWNVEACEKKRKPTQMILSAWSSHKIQTFQTITRCSQHKRLPYPERGGGEGGGVGTHSLAGKRR